MFPLGGMIRADTQSTTFPTSINQSAGSCHNNELSGLAWRRATATTIDLADGWESLFCRQPIRLPPASAVVCLIKSIFCLGLIDLLAAAGFGAATWRQHLAREAGP